MSRTLFLLFVVAHCGWAQSVGARLPRFEDYPVAEIYKGPLAPPKIATVEQQRYRTRIQEGVSKGWGVTVDGWGNSTPSPNFAGKMVLMQWACGSPCTMMAMVDATTGTVYSSPFAMARGELSLPLLDVRDSVAQPVDLQFRVDSGLLIVDATSITDNDRRSYTHYFLWDGGRWKLIRRVLLTDTH